MATEATENCPRRLLTREPIRISLESIESMLTNAYNTWPRMTLRCHIMLNLYFHAVLTRFYSSLSETTMWEGMKTLPWMKIPSYVTSYIYAPHRHH